MALSSLTANPYLPLRIVPCGLHYTHGHMFRSRAGVQFGEPIQIPRHLVEMFKSGKEKEAVNQLKELVYHRLRDITLKHPDSKMLRVGFSQSP
jgi:glycerol-3-phosphate O-acyltransferase/dihydroxyacetone phosphate acyltransferase